MAEQLQMECGRTQDYLLHLYKFTSILVILSLSCCHNELIKDTYMNKPFCSIASISYYKPYNIITYKKNLTISFI